MFLSLIQFTGCSSKSKNEITDIIPVVKLEAGNTDSVLVSDLFFAQNYDLNFADNPNLELKYLKDSKTLILRANDDYEGMTLVDFAYHNSVYSIPVVVEKLQKHTFTFTPQKEYKSITLFGSFNQWNRQTLPMTDDNLDGTYEITLPFEAGTYEYKFFADGEELLDPTNPEIVPSGVGTENSLLRIEPRHTDDIFLHQLKFAPDYNEYEFQYINEDRNVTLESVNVVALINNQKVKQVDIAVEGTLIKIQLDNTEGENLIRVGVTDKGQNSNIQHVHTYNGEPITNDYWTWYDGVIYSLMIDRFYDGNKSLNDPIEHDSLMDKANYMGGDLQGVINKLNENYFDSLGVNVIWISPVYNNPNQAYKEYPAPHRYYSGYHGYWPIHHLEVEEKFGTIEKVKELVKTAHDKNIKVLLDFVSNHVHELHPFYKNQALVLAHGN